MENQSELYKLMHPDYYFGCYYQNGMRPDGRKLEECRKMSFEFSSNDESSNDHEEDLSSLMVTKGNVIILSKININLIEQDDCGNMNLPVNVKVTFLPTSKSGTQSSSRHMMDSKFEDFLSYKIEKILKDHVLDMESLKIPNTSYNYNLDVNVLIIEADGNILETSLHAVMALLLNTKLPNIKINERKVEIIEGYKNEKIRIKNTLMSFGYGIYDEKLIPDPTLEEENIMKSFINIICDKNAKIHDKECNLDMIQMGKVDEKLLIQSLDMSKKRCKEISDILEAINCKGLKNKT